jgi:hypothetical protein
MSFTVFSARSIAHDLESAVGEEAFYFYMREIIEKKLFEKYVDDVNGEVKHFTDLVNFMTHKEGLGIKDLCLFEKCLGIVASSHRKVAVDAQWLIAQMKKASPCQEHGDLAGKIRDCKTGRIKPSSRHDNVRSGQYGNSRDYLLGCIARDQPELLDEIGPGKRFKSARAAAIEAGIITPFPSLQLKEPVPTAQKLLTKKGKEWCLQLLDELSALVFED